MIKGKLIEGNSEAIVKKAQLLMDTMVDHIVKGCEFHMFAPSVTAVALAVCIREAIGLDDPLSETARLYFLHGEEIIFSARILLQERLGWALTSI